MFTFLKNLLGGPAGRTAKQGSSGALVASRPVHQPRAAQAVPRPSPAQPSAAPAAKPRTASQPAAPATGEVNISLQAVLSELPPELAARFIQTDVRGATLSISIPRILAQLPSGSVQIPFGELRRAAPQLFSPGAESDQAPINLPLAEILARLDPSLIVRPQVQKPVAPPDEVSSPFERQKPSTASPANAAQLPASAQPRSVTPAAPAQPKPEVSRQSPAVPLRVPLKSSRPVTTPTSPTPAPAASRANGDLNPAPGAKPNNGTGQHAVRIPSSPTPQAAPVETNLMTVPFAPLVEAWPEELRREIARSNLSGAEVSLPAASLQEGLKRGRVAFPWKTIRSSIKPAPLAAASAHDDVMLELPLEIIAPLFFSGAKKVASPQQKIAIDDQIPDLFTGPAPVDPPVADAATGHGAANSSQRAGAGTADVSQDSEGGLRQKASGTNGAVRHATPNEIVSRAAALDGVAGAMVALPDGLMVASKLAPNQNGDTLAVFLSQAFGRISRSAKEMGMGEVNNLNFTVDNIPWKISHVNSIFFAAFGCSGRPLPTTQLSALAAELDHKIP
jgi:predicted regulator of Ras-like GTPase activity (Roadblock/LC7/MglB family)